MVKYSVDGKEIQFPLNLNENFFKKNEGNKSFIIPLNNQKETKTVTLTEIQIVNFNTDYSLALNQAQINTANTNKIIPANVLQEASDAKLKYKNLEITRSKNQIDDLIDGLIINLNKAPEKINLKVGKDSQIIFDNVVNFVGQYNITMRLLNKLLSTKDDRDEEDEDFDPEKGLLNDELLIKLLRDKMKEYAISPYPTATDKLAFLSQLGITSVFILGASDDIDNRTLNIDPDKYESAFLEFSETAADLFGFDSNGDEIIDTGFAFKIKELGRQYNITGGPLDIQKRAREDSIKSIDKNIEKEKEVVEEYEAKTRRDFSRLTESQQEMERMQNMLDNSLK